MLTKRSSRSRPSRTCRRRGRRPRAGRASRRSSPGTLGAGVAAGGALEERDDRAARGAELVLEPLRDGDRLGIRVGPATGAQRAGDLRGEEGRGDGEQDRDDDDRSAEAVGERSPAAEHVAALPGSVVGLAVNLCRATIENDIFSLSRSGWLRRRPCDGTLAEPTLSICSRGSMPRITADREAAVRERIVRAALEVFAEKGYHRATIADVVRALGAVRRGDLHALRRQGGAVPVELRRRRRAGARRARGRGWPASTTTEARLRAAIAYYVETIDAFDGAPGQVTLVSAWAEADAEPGVRADARPSSRATGRCRHAAAPGGHRARRPAVDARRRRLRARVHRPARRPAAAAHRGRRRLPAGRPDPSRRGGPRRPAGRRRGCRRSIASHGPRPDRPRPDRPGRPRLHAARTSTPRSRCGTCPIAGTTGS